MQGDVAGVEVVMVEVAVVAEGGAVSDDLGQPSWNMD